MKFFNVAILSTYIICTSISLHASAPAPAQQSMDNESGCCVISCKAMDKRASHCVNQRVSQPFKVITCQDEKSFWCDCVCEENLCCPSYECASSVFRLVSSFSCLVPFEIVCCPIYTVCGSKMAQECLCLDDIEK